MRQLLEHEGKALLAAAGVPVPRGTLATTADAAQAAAAELGGRVVLKAQVPIGGRGKAGGILVVDAGEARAGAERLLGATVRGFPVGALLVEEAIDARAELYLGIAVDPRARTPVLLLSAAGGVDVEAQGDQVARVPWHLGNGLRPAHVWQAAEAAGVAPETAAALIAFALAAAGVFRAQRAQLVELNPIMDAGERGLVAADVRVVADEALDPAPVPGDAAHAESKRLGFDYVTLNDEGEVGLITTGAGASMLLIDLLTEAGLSAIDFCDVRTGTLRGDSARLRFILEQLARCPNLRLILVNVFAGVTELGEFVELFLAELAAAPPPVPLVVRLDGRDAVAARERLSAAGVRCVAGLEELIAAATDLAAPGARA